MERYPEESTPNTPNPERQRVRTERQIEVIKRNHEAAVTAFELESLVTGEDIKSFDNEEIETVLQKLPSRLRSHYHEAMRNYFNDRKRIENYKSEIDAFVEEKNSYGIPIRDIPRELGKSTFRDIAHGESMGEVTLNLQEGYFIMSFEDPRDYARAVHGRDAIPASTSVPIEKSAGTYHRMRRIAFFEDKYYGPVIMVKKSEHVESIIAHERQHYINNRVFAGFKVTEGPVADTPQALEARLQRNIKDEVLAYMRDGSTGTSMERSLFGELYTHLFSSLGRSKDETESVVKKTAGFLNQHHEVLKSPEARAVLVYQLAHVPLEEFPKWLDALGKYYVWRYELLSNFDIDTSSSSWNMWSNWTTGIDDFSKNTFPSQYREYLDQSREKKDEVLEHMKSIRLEAKNLIFNQAVPISHIEETVHGLRDRYKELRGQLLEIYAPLMRDGVLIPRAKEMTTYEFGEDVADANQDTSEWLETVKQTVLDRLRNYPQQEIDSIISELGNPDKKQRKAHKRLEATAKQIVHSLNNHRPCWVIIDGEREYDPLSIYVAIEFRVSPEENRRGVKGAEFNIIFHGSDFKL